MKQNERLLVYAVTGFLAVILVIAVWFGNDASAGLRASAGADNSAQGVRDLGDLLGTDAPKVATGNETAGNQTTGDKPVDPQVSPANGEQPLVSNGGALVAADLVAQQLGPSRREHTVRWVVARAGDSLETLVQRWCGSRDFVEKALRLNETLGTVKIGQEVAVPWVDDEVVYEALQARQAKKLEGVSLGGDRLQNGRTQPVGGDVLPASPAASDTPKSPAPSRIADLLQVSPAANGLREPGKSNEGKSNESKANDGNSSETRSPAVTPDVPGPSAAVAAQRYTVKSGDSLWAIAAKVYGRKNADKMIPEIKRTNPGLTETLRPDQVLLLPAKQ